MSGSRLDETDVAILRHLSASPRSHNIAVARSVGLSASACLARTRRLENSGTLRLRAEVHEGVVAVWQTFWILTRLRPIPSEDRSVFEASVLAAPHVLEAHATIGDFDYLLKATTPSMADVSRLRAVLDPNSRVIERMMIIGGVGALKERVLHPLIGGDA